MDALFSCRNCIHNAGQSINVGRGPGFCVKHDSVLLAPEVTTCKYLHRKDLPSFVVDEGVREHAAEFAMAPGMANLRTHDRIPRTAYSERHVWDVKQFDPLVHSLAQYHKINPSWVFIQAFSGAIDGRRTLAHAGLVRRYMAHCGTWRSSYRLVMALVQELPFGPCFNDTDLSPDSGLPPDETRAQATWDVFFARLSGVQEYGFHAGIEPLIWATDELNGGLSTLDWPLLRLELQSKAPEWTDLITTQAKAEGAYFPAPAAQPPEETEPEEA